MDDADDGGELNRSSQIFAVSWVKQKAALLVPNQVKLSEDDLKFLGKEK